MVRSFTSSLCLWILRSGAEGRVDHSTAEHKMILVDGDKYACVQCIRGHRSSTCKHTLRPLVQVRGRGRPSSNAGHRIAVTESELVLTKEQVTLQSDLDNKKETGSCCADKEVKKERNGSCCVKKPVEKPKKSCSCKGSTACKCQGEGVIILKASKRQFVDVQGGTLDFVGEYNDQALKKFRIGSGRSCHNNSNANLTPLKTLQVNEVSKAAVKREPTVVSRGKNNMSFDTFSYPQPSFEEPINSERFYDMFKAEGCSEECNCGPDCACPGCLIHRTNEELSRYGLLDSSTMASSTPNGSIQSLPVQQQDSQASPYSQSHSRSQTVIYQERTPEPPNQLEFINFQTMNEVDFQGLLDSGCLCSDDACACYNCVKHGIFNGVRQSDNMRVSETPSPGPAVPHYHQPIPLLQDSPIQLQQSHIQQLDHDHDHQRTLLDQREQRSLSSQQRVQQQYQTLANGSPYPYSFDGHECGCSPHECECFNCLKHGRVNGVKIR